ncbi:MAG: hypothetical protein EZS28_043954 [Streblomastix strix]|uniref:Uncharacterized protein n=1 Tax=Streblomastix strix TaxID=222440 RepID=A0A5J4TRJ0_9EUKA|nr:MAG: hypothetical protein EZS28_043954 [Streblomastix strix]
MLLGCVLTTGGSSKIEGLIRVGIGIMLGLVVLEDYEVDIGATQIINKFIVKDTTYILKYVDDQLKGVVLEIMLYVYINLSLLFLYGLLLVTLLDQLIQIHHHCYCDLRLFVVDIHLKHQSILTNPKKESS